ncbi:MAG: outer membrane protein assembly factor BamB family protein [Candidatus Dormibacteria bacterium]
MTARRNLLLVSLVASALGAAQALQAVPTAARDLNAGTRGQWSQFMFDAGHTGFNPNETVLSPSQVAGLHQLWDVSLGPAAEATQTSAPVIVDGVVYDAWGSNDVAAVRLSDRHVLWRRHFDAAVGSRPAVVNGVLYATVGSALYALRASTGSKVWSYDTRQDLYFTVPTAANGVVYLTTTNGVVYSFNGATGAKRWSRSVGGQLDSAPALGNGAIVVATNLPSGARVLALGRSSGHVLWTRDVPGTVWRGGPAVSRSTVYVGANANVSTLYALRLSDGKRLWSGPLGREMDTTPAVAGDTVIAATIDDGLRAFDARDGAVRWNATRGEFWASPVIADGVAYIVEDVGTLRALRASSGAVLWFVDQQAFGSAAMGTVAVLDGVVYSATPAGVLVAYGLGPR